MRASSRQWQNAGRGREKVCRDRSVQVVLAVSSVSPAAAAAAAAPSCFTCESWGVCSFVKHISPRSSPLQAHPHHQLARPVSLLLHSPSPSAPLHQSCRFGLSSSPRPRRHSTQQCPTKSPQTPAIEHLRISQAQSPAPSCPPMSPYQTS
jgi:hypothetical protein